MSQFKRYAGVAVVLVAGMLIAVLPVRGTAAGGPTTKPVNTMCAVEPSDPVDPAVTYTYNGTLIGFCCEHCIPKFKADPEKYMKTLK